MSQTPNRQPGRASSLSGRPKAFAHVKNIRPEFQMASTGEREKAKLRARAPKVRKDFGKAHEGPREELSKPRLEKSHTPHGPVVNAVHTKVEREKAARNRQKDQQMKKWRERKVPQPTRTDRPNFDLKKQSPDVLAGAKKRSVEQILREKRARSRGRGGRGR